jgi:NAD(P)H-dependent flavin oxidoreductase YrpB (nitropropane dioxygenase family)
VARFIFMLTRDDRTIPDARAVYANVAGTGITDVGCKDIGLPREELGALIEDIRARGHTSYLEVVSESEEATLASARAAAELRPDYLIGGTLIEPVQEIIAGTDVRFFPYVGSVIGHPCLLRGAIPDVVEDARRAESLGAHGINLLAYRYDGDVDELVQEVVSAISIPVIAAGSVDSAQRVRALADGGAWAFTIGTAALERKLVPGAPIEEQLAHVLAATGEARTPSQIGGTP